MPRMKLDTLNSTIERSFGAIRDPSLVRDVIAETRARRKAILDDANLSDEGKKAQLDQLEQQAAAAARDYSEMIATHLEAARSAIERARQGETPETPHDEVLHEMRLTRAHARIARMLDAGTPLEKAAQIAAQAGDRAAFTALRELVPLQHAANPDRKKILAAQRAVIEQAEVPLLGEVETRARELAAELQQVEAWAQQNVQAVEREVANPDTAHLFIAGPNRVIDIESGNPLGHNGRPVAPAATGGRS
jgi:hypothetical protein